METLEDYVFTEVEDFIHTVMSIVHRLYSHDAGKNFCDWYDEVFERVKELSNNTG